MRHMKALFVLVSIALLASGVAVAQGTAGTLSFCNASAPTRLGSAGGPLAGSAHFAQLLVGSAPDSLAPATGQFLTTRLPISPLSHLPESGLIGNFDVCSARGWCSTTSKRARRCMCKSPRGTRRYGESVRGRAGNSGRPNRRGPGPAEPLHAAGATPEIHQAGYHPGGAGAKRFSLESLAIALLGGLLRVRGSRGSKPSTSPASVWIGRAAGAGVALVIAATPACRVKLGTW